MKATWFAHASAVAALILVAGCTALPPSPTPPAAARTLPATSSTSTASQSPTAAPSPAATLTPAPAPRGPASLVPEDARLRLTKGALRWMLLSRDGLTMIAASETAICSYRVADAAELWCAQVGEQGKPAHLTGLSLSTDGETLAGVTLGDPPDLYLWDVRSGALRAALHFPFSYASDPAWSTDSSQLAVSAQALAGGAPSIQILSLSSLTLSGAISTGDFLSIVLAWSPDGAAIASGDVGGQVQLWHPGSNQPVFSKKPFPGGHSVSGVVFAPGGSTLVASSIFYSCYENCSANYDGAIVQLDARSGAVLRTIPTGKAVVAFSLHPDGNRIAALLNWNEIGLFSLAQGARLDPQARLDHLTALAWMPDRASLLTLAGDDRRILWDAALKRTDDRSLTGFGAFYSAAWSPDSSRLAAVSSSGLIHVWYTRDGSPSAVFGLANPYSTLSWSLDGKWIASTDGKTITLWNALTSQQARVIQAAGANITDLAWSPDGRFFATLDYGTYLAIRDAQSWVLLGSIQVQPKDFRLAWSPDGSRIATAGEGAVVWDAASRQKVSSWASGVAVASSALNWSPDGKQFLVSDGSAVLRVDALSGKEMDRIAFKDRSVGAALFSPDGKLLILGMDPLSLRVLSSGEISRTWIGSPGGVVNLSLSPDGKTLASFDDTGSILFWDYPTPVGQNAASSSNGLVTPLPNRAGLTIEENPIAGSPSLDPLTFQPVYGSQQDVLGRHAAGLLPPYSVQLDFIQNSAVLTANDDPAFAAKETFINESASSHSRIEVQHAGVTVYQVDIGAGGPIETLRGLWVDGATWTLELNSPQPDALFSGQLYQNGQLLNSKYGFTEMFGYQRLDGRPLYFYRKDGRVHLAYDGQELPVEYDEVPHYQCCSGAALNPRSSPNGLTFWGRRAGVWYYVQIGRYPE